MSKLGDLFKSKKVKLICGTVVGFTALLLIVKAATPSTVNIVVNNGKSEEKIKE